MNMKWNASLGRRPELSIYESDARTRIEIIPKYRWMKLGAEVRLKIDSCLRESIETVYARDRPHSLLEDNPSSG